MKVYRIEHKHYGLGPYQSWYCTPDSRYFDSRTCPGPTEDGIPGMQENEFSGFQCMRHLTNWFKLIDIFKMQRRGFRVYKYGLNPRYARLGGKQLAFQKAYAYNRVEVKYSTLLRHVALSRLSLT